MIFWAPVEDSQTVPDSLLHIRGTSKRLPKNLRRCQDHNNFSGNSLMVPDSLPHRLGTSRRLKDRTVCDSAMIVCAPVGDS
ncbi:hypothetical protein DPMN_118139 [Dreissena polymorpha]|uniref:Uncharacterized protein n=1 Tax=Dreissena polymorpha TaxID=45954 RepID=A0A9D4JLE0_DREPO|nr:hypothetical protein DPMN_118139 [Dreissena polymorpha]